MSRRRRFAALIVSAPLALAACGGGDADRDALVTSLLETGEIELDDANCIADDVFSSDLVAGLDQDTLNRAGNDPASVPGFQDVVDTALAACLGL